MVNIQYYLFVVSIIVNPVITCDEIIEKCATSKIKDFHILLSFLLITIELLIAVRIHCYLIKCKSKQKHLLPYYITNDKLKETLF